MYIGYMPLQVVEPCHHLPTMRAFLSFSLMDGILVPHEVSESAKTANPTSLTVVVLAKKAFRVTSFVLTNSLKVSWRHRW